MEQASVRGITHHLQSEGSGVKEGTEREVNVTIFIAEPGIYSSSYSFPKRQALVGPTASRHGLTWPWTISTESGR